MLRAVWLSWLSLARRGVRELSGRARATGRPRAARARAHVCGACLPQADIYRIVKVSSASEASCWPSFKPTPPPKTYPPTPKPAPPETYSPTELPIRYYPNDLPASTCNEAHYHTVSHCHNFERGVCVKNSLECDHFEGEYLEDEGCNAPGGSGCSCCKNVNPALVYSARPTSSPSYAPTAIPSGEPTTFAPTISQRPTHPPKRPSPDVASAGAFSLWWIALILLCCMNCCFVIFCWRDCRVEMPFEVASGRTRRFEVARYTRNDDRRLSSRETTHRREPRNDAAHRYRRRDDDDELDEHLGDEKQAFATCDLDGDLVLEDVYAGKAV